MTILSANHGNLVVPVWSKHGVDAVFSEKVVELVLVLDTLGLLGLTELGEFDAEFITVRGAPVAEVVAAVWVPSTVALSSTLEVVVVIVVIVR